MKYLYKTLFGCRPAQTWTGDPYIATYRSFALHKDSYYKWNFNQFILINQCSALTNWATDLYFVDRVGFEPTVYQCTSS